MAAPEPSNARSVSSDPIATGSTVVALALLAVIAIVLTIGAIRYDEGDLAKLVGSLGPLIGIVTGAFVTYFFTRSAVQTTTQTAAAESAQATSARDRSKDLHNALTDVLAQVSDIQGAALTNLPSVKKVLGGGSSGP